MARKPKQSSEAFPDEDIVAEEMFYLDDKGVRQDSFLHNTIIGMVDNPIDEDLMGPIREKHRKAWQAKQKAKGKR